MIFPGSARVVGDAQPIDIVLLDSLGNPVFGFDPSRPSDAALTQPTVSTTTSVLLASNPLRRGYVIVNNTSKIMRIAYAATASQTAFTYELADKGTLAPNDGYTGDISAVTASGTGTARVTEILP